MLILLILDKICGNRLLDVRFSKNFQGSIVQYETRNLWSRLSDFVVVERATEVVSKF